MIKSDSRPKSQRCLRVGEEVRRILAQMFQEDTFKTRELMGRSITVTEVQVSPDFSHASVFVMPLAGTNKNEIISFLNIEAPLFRKTLSQALKLRTVPKLRFHLDETFEHFQKINELLNSRSSGQE